MNLTTALIAFALAACSRASAPADATTSSQCVAPAGSSPAAEGTPAGNEGTVMNSDKVVRTEAEWRKTLTPEQYHVLREKGGIL